MEHQSDSTPTSWSANTLTSQPLMQNIESLPQAEPGVSSVQTSVFTAPNAAAGFTALQLTESQLQQLTQQGIIQTLLQPNVPCKPSTSEPSPGMQQVFTLQTDVRNSHQSQFFTVPFLMGNVQQPSQDETVSQSADRVIALPQPSANAASANISDTAVLPSLDVGTSQLGQSATALNMPAAGVSIGHENTDSDPSPLHHHSLFRVADSTLDSTALLAQTNDQSVTSLGFSLNEDVTRSTKVQQIPSSYQNDHTAAATYQAIPQEAAEVTFTPAPSNQLTSVTGTTVTGPETREAEPTFHLMGHAELQPHISSTNTHCDAKPESNEGQTVSATELGNILSSTQHGSTLSGMELVSANPNDEDDDEDDDDEEEDVEIVSHASQEADGNSGSQVQPNTPADAQVRKSERIAYMAREPSPTARASYVPRPYSTQELWCEECMCSYESMCPNHKLTSLFDKVVLSRAWASLPKQLQIFRLSETDGTELGVFAKRPIPKQVQFGPFVAEFVASKEFVSSTKFILMIERGGNDAVYLEASDENRCNWMMFVRPAASYSEQNLVAYQHGTDIFFSTIKAIEPRQELKVWYAAHYAERLGTHIHELSEEDLEALGEAALRWPCYECSKRFRTSAQLQKHLILHERAEQTAAEAGDSSTEDATVHKPQRRRLRHAKGKKRGRPAKKLKLDSAGSGDDTPAFQSWKKKKTNMYLNRLKKYREPVKRSIKTLYKRTGKDSGGNEWVCTHCGLTFDNPSLLNLHTLTHAAEDVCLDDLKQLTGAQAGASKPLTPGADNADADFIKTAAGVKNDVSEVMTAIDDSVCECPVCKQLFDKKKDLIQHASVHAKSGRNPNKPYSCSACWKSFATVERLQRHFTSHDENSKPLQCLVCFKRLTNNSALACHMKTHSENKYYECPICLTGFDQIHALRNHATSHAVNGIYDCPNCHKSFSEFKEIKKHMKSLHSQKQYPCPHCEKVLPRLDKFKLHLLKHSDHREFICETCGKQFKRRDKLREHIKKVHQEPRKSASQSDEQKNRRVNPNKFTPKVSPTDYQRFIYKCHLCLLGFKRRGMLVNHLAKRHPDITPDTVPELNLPILKTQKDYFCQYCDKVYKSSSKRKLHILKNHPGSELPASARKKSEEDLPGFPNPTYSQTVGSVTTVPHACQLCHKQYASKAKLLQHLRKQHSSQITTIEQPQKIMETEKSKVFPTALANARPLDTNEIPAVATVTLPGNQQITDNMQAADLLTQAMTELTQSLEFRHQQQQQQQQQQPTGLETQHVQQDLTAQLAQRPDSPLQTVTIHTVPAGASIELSQLGQHLLHSQYQVQTSPSNNTTQQTQISPGQDAALSQQITIVSSGNAQQNTITVPLSIAQTLIGRSWAPTNPTTFPSYR